LNSVDLPLPENQILATALATQLRAALSELTIHSFPDEESYVRIDTPVLIGPDSESLQRVAAVATAAESPYFILEKIRHGDRDVEASAPQVAHLRARTPVLVDDIISTARTMIKTLAHLKHAGQPAPVCMAVHAVMAGAAYEELRTAGAAEVVTCNTILYPSNAIDATPLIADAILALDLGAR